MASSSALEQNLINAGQIIEEQLDAEIERLSNLEDNDLERLRHGRLEEMKKKNALKQEWLNSGHGEYTEITNEKEFFEASKKSSKLIIHFYCVTSENCKIVDSHFNLLSKSHLETRFLKINAEKSPFLVEKLKIKIMPAVVLVKDGQIVGQLRGFDSLGVQNNEFPTELFEWRLATFGVLDYAGDLSKRPGGEIKKKNILGLKAKEKCKKSIKSSAGRNDSDEDSGDDW